MQPIKSNQIIKQRKHTNAPLHHHTAENCMCVPEFSSVDGQNLCAVS